MRAISCDFLVTGPVQVKVLGEKLFGSTAARILRHAGQPVLAVRRREEGPYHKVTVSVNFSDASRHAYPYGRAVLPDANFTLIYAYEVAPNWGGKTRTSPWILWRPKRRSVSSARLNRT